MSFLATNGIELVYVLMLCLKKQLVLTKQLFYFSLKLRIKNEHCYLMT